MREEGGGLSASDKENAKNGYILLTVALSSETAYSVILSLVTGLGFKKSYYRKSNKIKKKKSNNPKGQTPGIVQIAKSRIIVPVSTEIEKY